MKNCRSTQFAKIACVIIVLILVFICVGYSDPVSSDNSGSPSAPKEKDIAFNAEFLKHTALLIIERTEQVQLIDSYNEFIDNLDDLSDRHSGAGEGSTISTDDLKQRYVEPWFTDHQLLVIGFSESSGSNRLKVVNLHMATDTVIVEMERIIPEELTCDGEYWQVMIEIDRCLPKDIGFELKISKKGA